MARNGGSGNGDTTIRDELAALGAQMSRLGEKTLSEGQERVAEEIDRLKGRLQEVMEQVEDHGETALDTVVSTVQRRPLTSMFSAFAAGIVLSSLLARR